jgi:hypothetical protein
MASAIATLLFTIWIGSCFGAGFALSLGTASSFTGETGGGGADEATLISLVIIFSSYK